MKAVKGHRYLCRRGEQLYFRRRVPLSARAAFGGREEVQKSLGTGDLAEARHLLAIEAATFDKLIADAAGKPVTEAVRQIVRERQPSRAEMEEAVRKWLLGRVERATDCEMAFGEGDAQQLWNGFQAQAESVKQGIGLGAREPSITTTWLAEGLCEAEGWKIEQGSSLWLHLLRLLGRGQIEANSWLASDLNGDPRTIQDARFAPEQYRLTDDEARLILSATLTPPPARLSPERKLARRWVPWICAYTGARVGRGVRGPARRDGRPGRSRRS